MGPTRRRLNRRSGAKRLRWRAGEVRGIPGGAVKCVEIGKNTRGEGGALAWP